MVADDVQGACDAVAAAKGAASATAVARALPQAYHYLQPPPNYDDTDGGSSAVFIGLPSRQASRLSASGSISRVSAVAASA